jgi:hypothetical protein
MTKFAMWALESLLLLAWVSITPAFSPTKKMTSLGMPASSCASMSEVASPEGVRAPASAHDDAWSVDPSAADVHLIAAGTTLLLDLAAGEVMPLPGATSQPLLISL